MDATTNDLTLGQAVFCIAENGDEFTGFVWALPQDTASGRYLIWFVGDGSDRLVQAGNLFPLHEDDFRQASRKIYNSRHVMPDP
jgi:hypothetical protein